MQNSWQSHSENENNNHSNSRENQERNRSDGFEGMNYEQRRQPFMPQHANNPSQKNSSSEEGKAPNQA